MVQASLLGTHDVLFMNRSQRVSTVPAGVCMQTVSPRRYSWP